jgi:hypothetical protein
MVTKEKNPKVRRLTDNKFCEKYGHVESKCFKNMEALEETMKKHNINIDSSSSSFGHAHSASGFSFNATSTFSYDECLIYFGTSYHMDKDKAMLSSLNECNTKKIFVGDDRFVIVVGSRTIQVENGHFNDVMCSNPFLQPSISVSDHSFR